MPDLPPPTPAPENETPVQQTARLRREKRAAKLASGGAEDRLARIKALNGGVAPDEEMLGGPAAPAPPHAASHDADPEEVDISTHAYTPASRGSGATAPGTRRGAGGGGSAGAGFAGMGGTGHDGQADPMAAMLQQMLGGQQAGGGLGSSDPSASDQQLPPLLRAFMGATGSGQTQPVAKSASAYTWRIAHASFALLLAGYIALTGAFDGTLLARSQSAFHPAGNDIYFLGAPRLFLVFATAELLLQGSRFFLENGRGVEGGGWISVILNLGVVPPPFDGWLKMAGRYSAIYTTLVSDAMVVVFVLGGMAWWQGRAAAEV